MIERLLKVATPFTAAIVVVPDRAPPPGFVPIATVTLAELVGTTRLLASSTRTVTTGEMGALVPALEGWVPKARWVGTPEIEKAALVAPPRPALAAVRV